MKRVLLCVLALTVGWGSAASWNVATGAVAGAADVGKGRQLFAAVGCFECHGYLGQGGSGGPKVAPNPIAFAAFLQYLRTPANQMPPYTAKVLPDTDVADIYAFLESIPPPPKIKFTD
ncbi:MAG TPA: cytochrome c [Steroidobacteraceae bacterium]|jgi:ubiquinol-cytochrome c reductase cytochrome c subunit